MDNCIDLKHKSTYIVGDMTSKVGTSVSGVSNNMTFEEMYRDFRLTREGVLVYTWETGFITYKVEDAETVYAIDLYSAPSARNQGITLQNYQEFENKIKSEGYKYLITSVAFFDENSTNILTKMIKSGYKLFSANNELLFVRKEI
jgi:hypothetical protein